MDRRLRLDAVRDALAPRELDALLVTKRENLRWLTGFTGSAGMALVHGGQLLVVTDGRYRDQVVDELTEAGIDADIEITTSPARVLRAATGEVARLALEADDVSWAVAATADTDWFPAAEVVATRGLIEELRAVKSPAEVDRIEAAGAIADAALAEVIPMFAEHPTEIDIAIALESTMRHLGAEGPAFETIVASGPNSAVPHHRPTSRMIGEGDLVVIDMGATVDGYRSDMTRSFSLGAPDQTAARLLDVVAAAQRAGLDAVAAGVDCSEVDGAARGVIAGAGWGEAFVHPTGHGVGLEIHEPLRLSATAGATLAAGHVVTVEPGVYLAGVGGVRIEDTVEVTAHGCRRLTRASPPVIVG